MKFRNALFDIDGTLLDTKEFLFQAYEHTFQVHGLQQIPRVKIARVIGLHLPDIYRDFFPDEDAGLLIETHRAFQKAHPELVKPYAGIPDLIRELAERNVRMATVTSRTGRSARQTLVSAGLARHFPVQIGPEDTNRHKPDPAPYLLALERLGAAPDASIVVGDAPFDIQSGAKAKCRTAAVTWGFGEKQALEAEKPDHLVGSTDELRRLILG